MRKTNYNSPAETTVSLPNESPSMLQNFSDGHYYVLAIDTKDSFELSQNNFVLKSKVSSYSLYSHHAAYLQKVHLSTVSAKCLKTKDYVSMISQVHQGNAARKRACWWKYSLWLKRQWREAKRHKRLSFRSSDRNRFNSPTTTPSCFVSLLTD